MDVDPVSRSIYPEKPGLARSAAPPPEEKGEIAHLQVASVLYPTPHFHGLTLTLTRCRCPRDCPDPPDILIPLQVKNVYEEDAAL